MTGFFQTLLTPDREDEPERAEVAKAANLLQIGEFQLLQLAYFRWHGEEMADEESNQVFRAYMLHSRVPAWARHYARRILELAARDLLDDGDPAYHRYDCDYYKAEPLGKRRLTLAVASIAFVVAGGLVLGHFAAPHVAGLFPPLIDNESEAPPGLPGAADLRGS